MLSLLSIAGCNPFAQPEVPFESKGPKPKQVVNIPAILDTSHAEIKSRQEIKALIGVPPTKDDSITLEWSFPEGRFTVFYFDKERDFMAFDPKAPGADSIEDMAALIGIDLKGRHPDEFAPRRASYAYNDLDVNGKMVSADFERKDGKISVLRLHEREKTAK